jgi:hypothetical protein
MEMSGQPVRKEAGQGRSVYLPSMQFDGRLPDMVDYFRIENRFWKRPKNWADLADAITWAAKDNVLLRVGGPDFLVANVTAQQEQRRMMLHLVNYKARNGVLTGPIPVQCRVPQPVREVRLYSPDVAEPYIIPSHYDASAVSFEVPPVKVYSIAVMNW